MTLENYLLKKKWNYIHENTENIYKILLSLLKLSGIYIWLALIR